MRALIYDPAARQSLRLAEVSEPQPRTSQALIDVAAVSSNFGEIAFWAGSKPGHVSGRDAAGAGAHVIASVGSEARAEGLRELGAAEIVYGPENLPAWLRARFVHARSF